MVDVSGIPNMGFGGGGYFGGIPNQQPAMSAAQINAGIWGNYSPQQAQATQNNIYGAGGFGAQPAYYAGLGAAYGRQVAPSSPAAVAAYHGGGGGGYPSGAVQRGPDLPDLSSDPFNPYVSQLQQQGGNYNAPRQYGWDANEGAPVPQQAAPFQRGMFNPQTYGWDANEGADPYQGQQNFQDLWNDRGRVYQPPFVPSPYGPGGAPTGISPPAQQSSIWDTYGGADVQAAARAAGRSMADFGPQHARDFGLNEGRGIFDKVAYLNKYQDVKDAGVDAYQHYLQFGKNEGREAPMTTNRDAIASLLAAQGGGGGYDMSAQSRAYQSPLQGFDWAQSYGTAGGANAAMLRAAGGASPGYYNPQLDQLSRSTLGMNNQPVDYSHMFGAPGSGYLGSQGRLNQDPFGGYVNPRDLDAGGSFPGNYQPRFDIPPGGGWMNTGA